MSELNRSNHSYLNLTKGVFTKGLVSIMMLAQDPPSPSLNDNLSITADRLIYP